MAAERNAKPTGGEQPDLAFGEEETHLSGPGTDLLGALLVGALGAVATVLAWLLPNPGSPMTAPGLLPLLIGGSLVLMALGLGSSALRAGGARELGKLGRVMAGDAASRADRMRTGLLMAVILVYVLLLDRVSFDWPLPLGFVELRFSSYEAVSIPVLTLVLRLFWRGAWWRCLLVAAVTLMALAWTFRYGFRILLPGSG